MNLCCRCSSFKYHCKLEEDVAGLKDVAALKEELDGTKKQIIMFREELKEIKIMVMKNKP